MVAYADGGLVTAASVLGDPTCTVAGCNLTDLRVDRYAPDGRRLWSRRLGGDADEFAGDVAVAPDGSIVVAGQVGFQATPMDERDPVRLLLLKYAAGGSLLWSREWGQPHRDFGGGHIAVSSDGAIWVMGQHPTPDYEPWPFPKGEWALSVLRLDGSGRLQWLRHRGAARLGIPGAHDIVGTALVASDDGVHVTGYAGSTDAAVGQEAVDVLTAKIDGSGRVAWHRLDGGPGPDWGFDLAIGAVGAPYIVGTLGRLNGLGIRRGGFIAALDPARRPPRGGARGGGAPPHPAPPGGVLYVAGARLTPDPSDDMYASQPVLARIRLVAAAGTFAGE